VKALFAIAMLALMLGSLPAFANWTAQETADYRAFSKTGDASISIRQLDFNSFKYVGKHVTLPICMLSQLTSRKPYAVFKIVGFNTSVVPGTKPQCRIIEPLTMVGKVPFRSWRPT
jgi:hypothetical protein